MPNTIEDLLEDMGRELYSQVKPDYDEIQSLKAQLWGTPSAKLAALLKALPNPFTEAVLYFDMLEAKNRFPQIKALLKEQWEREKRARADYDEIQSLEAQLWETPSSELAALLKALPNSFPDPFTEDSLDLYLLSRIKALLKEQREREKQARADYEEIQRLKVQLRETPSSELAALLKALPNSFPVVRWKVGNDSLRPLLNPFDQFSRIKELLKRQLEEEELKERQKQEEERQKQKEEKRKQEEEKRKQEEERRKQEEEKRKRKEKRKPMMKRVKIIIGVIGLCVIGGAIFGATRGTTLGADTAIGGALGCAILGGALGLIIVVGLFFGVIGGAIVGIIVGIILSVAGKYTIGIAILCTIIFAIGSAIIGAISGAIGKAAGLR